MSDCLCTRAACSSLFVRVSESSWVTGLSPGLITWLCQWLSVCGSWKHFRDLCSVCVCMCVCVHTREEFVCVGVGEKVSVLSVRGMCLSVSPTHSCITTTLLYLLISKSSEGSNTQFQRFIFFNKLHSVAYPFISSSVYLASIRSSIVHPWSIVFVLFFHSPLISSFIYQSTHLFCHPSFLFLHPSFAFIYLFWLTFSSVHPSIFSYLTN